MPKRFDVKEFMNAWNTHQSDRIADFYAQDAEIHVPPDPEPYRGRDGVRENVKEVTRGMEDINGDIAWSIQEGNKLSALIHVSGKHTGPMPLTSDRIIPATNQTVRFMVGIFAELDEDGKIRRETDLVDNLGILEQVGALERAMAGGQEAARGQGTPKTR